MLKFISFSQSQVSNDPKQQAKDKTKNSIPLLRKDYDWLDSNMWKTRIDWNYDANILFAEIRRNKANGLLLNMINHFVSFVCQTAVQHNNYS